MSDGIASTLLNDQLVIDILDNLERDATEDMIGADDDLGRLTGQIKVNAVRDFREKLEEAAADPVTSRKKAVA